MGKFKIYFVEKVLLIALVVATIMLQLPYIISEVSMLPKRILNIADASFTRLEVKLGVPGITDIDSKYGK